LDGVESALCRATTPGAGIDRSGTIPLRLAHTDWLQHRLSITGPDAAAASFRTAAAAAGVIPCHLDRDRLEEDCFHRLVAPPVPQPRSLSLAGARFVAGQLRFATMPRSIRSGTPSQPQIRQRRAVFSHSESMQVVDGSLRPP
jgi:hypothetical protein